MYDPVPITTPAHTIPLSMCPTPSMTACLLTYANGPTLTPFNDARTHPYTKLAHRRMVPNIFLANRTILIALPWLYNISRVTTMTGLPKRQASSAGPRRGRACSDTASWSRSNPHWANWSAAQRSKCHAALPADNAGGALPVRPLPALACARSHVL